MTARDITKDSLSTSTFQPLQSETKQLQIPPVEAVRVQKMEKEEIIRILHQYADHRDYRAMSSVVMNGFIRSSQKEIRWIIPSDINDVCFSFYFEAENSSVHIAHTLYQRMTAFSGECLVSMLEDDAFMKSLGVSRRNTMEICEDLVRFGFVEMVSYKISFDLLFKQRTETKGLFHSSSDYQYKLTEHAVEAFKEYLKVHPHIYTAFRSYFSAISAL